jgi:hypothetical protein
LRLPVADGISAVRARAQEGSPLPTANAKNALFDQPLCGEPFRDHVGDLGVVLVHHQHVGIALDAEIRKVDDIDLGSSR